MKGLAILFYVPRLPLMFALLFGIYLLLWHDRSSVYTARNWTRYAWVAVMAVSLVFTMLSTFRRERAVRQEYAYRVPLQTQGFLNEGPRNTDTGVRYIAFTIDGCRLITEGQGVASVGPPRASAEDDLSFGSGSDTSG